MKYFIILLILILLGIGGYFIVAKNYKSPDKTTDTNQAVSCTVGVNGNSGDNYCSNTHSTSSRCLPRLDNTYPDGCTK